MKPTFTNLFIIPLLVIVIYLLGSLFPINTLFNGLKQTPTLTPFPTTVPTITSNITITSKPQNQIRKYPTQQITIPTAMPKVPVYLTSINKTANCVPESTDAIKSADLAFKESNRAYQTCVGDVGVAYVQCSSSCYAYASNLYSECVDSCHGRYNADECTKPNSDSLQNLIKQYCK